MIDYLSKPVKFEDLQVALYRRVLCPRQGESADMLGRYDTFDRPRGGA